MMAGEWRREGWREVEVGRLACLRELQETEGFHVTIICISGRVVVYLGRGQIVVHTHKFLLFPGVLQVS